MSEKSAAQKAAEYKKAWYRIADKYGVDVADATIPKVAPVEPGQKERPMGGLADALRGVLQAERRQIAGYVRAGLTPRQATQHASQNLRGHAIRDVERVRMTGVYAEAKVAMLDRSPLLKDRVSVTTARGRPEIALRGAGKATFVRIGASAAEIKGKFAAAARAEGRKAAAAERRAIRPVPKAARAADRAYWRQQAARFGAAARDTAYRSRQAGNRGRA